MTAGNIFYFDWEISLMTAIQAHFGPVGVFVSRFLSLLGQEYPLVLIVAILYFSGNKQLGKRVCINLMSVLVWVPMIKNVTFRIRPYFAHEEIDILLPPVPTADAYDMVAQGFSFPSAHAACSFAAYPVVGKSFNKKWTTIVGYIIPILVGLSRFCVGAHYPTDVLVGWAVGIIVLILLPFLYSKLDENLVNFVILLSAIPGAFYCQTEDFYSGFGLLIGACFAFWFESKYVNFKTTKKVGRVIIRCLVGLVFFLAIAQGMKLIVEDNLAVRVIRYALGAFVAMGLYPMLFKKFEKDKE